MSVSITDAQVTGGDCIEFRYDAHTTTIALVDTCRNDTIYVGATRTSGPWQLVGSGVTIAVKPGRYITTADTSISSGRWVVFEGDSAWVPADTTIRTTTRRDRDTLLFTSAAGSRVYVSSYSSDALTPGLGSIDSTTTTYGTYGIIFPNYDSDIFFGSMTFANNGSDSSRFTFSGGHAPHQWTKTSYLESVHIIMQWSGGSGYTSISLAGIPALSPDSVLVFHVRSESGSRLLRIYKRAAARGFSFTLGDPYLDFIAQYTLPVSWSGGGTWPSVGNSVQLLAQVRARRKHL